MADADAEVEDLDSDTREAEVEAKVEAEDDLVLEEDEDESNAVDQTMSVSCPSNNALVDGNRRTNRLARRCAGVFVRV